MHQNLLLNSLESFDLDTGKASKKPYEPIDLNDKLKYVGEVLSQYKYDYEYDDDVTLDQLLELIDGAYNRYNAKREQLNFSTSTNVYVYLPDNKMALVSCSGKGYFQQ